MTEFSERERETRRITAAIRRKQYSRDGLVFTVLEYEPSHFVGTATPVHDGGTGQCIVELRRY